MTGNAMPEILAVTVDEQGNEEMGEIDFCELHDGEIRMALIQHGFSEELELSDEERLNRMIAGEFDAYLVVKNRLVIGVLQTFGASSVLANKGCPVCTFNSVIEMAVDGVAMERRKSN